MTLLRVLTLKNDPLAIVFGRHLSQLQALSSHHLGRILEAARVFGLDHKHFHYQTLFIIHILSKVRLVLCVQLLVYIVEKVVAKGLY